MSRWDKPSHDEYSDEEESRLLKKFYDYAEIEKKESERRRFLEVSSKKRTSIWGNRFVLSAIIQGSIVTGLTVALILMQMVFVDTSMTHFLSLSLDGPAKWFFFGYFMYITLVVAITITAIFFNHLESNMNHPIRGSRRYLVWAQFFGMNVGGAITTILLIAAGFIGTGFVGFVSGEPYAYESIVESVKIPITVSALIFAVGMVCGGVAYITAYLSSPRAKISDKMFDESKYERF